MGTPSRQDSKRASQWERLDDDALLDLRFRELGLRLDSCLVQVDVERLYDDLERRGIRFRPHVWLSTEWFSPDGVPGIAVPYFVAHSRLARLERNLMGEVEGGNRKSRLRILRHEAGHALDTAYGLRRRADWRRIFGHASKRYPSHYQVRPGSRRYVQHLGQWYAQSHPTEDFAETFAVWLQPKARWRRDYAGWPALRKLEFVDALMDEVAGRAPRNRSRQVIASLSHNSRSLGEHYRRKHAAPDRNERRYDANLMRVFARRADQPRRLSVATLVRDLEAELRRGVIRRTHVNRYVAEHVIESVRRRARQLDLVLKTSRRESRYHLLQLLEHVTFDLLHRNRERYVL